MKVQKALIAEHQFVWLVLGDDYRPIKPILAFSRYLNNTEHSPNTLRAYANHLKLYWEYLEANRLSWESVKLDQVAEFILWLRLNLADNKGQAKRTESTINTILAAVSSFYEFHRQLGCDVIELTKTVCTSSRAYKPLLHHVSKKSRKVRVIKLKQPKSIPKILQKEQVEAVMGACGSDRDRFLVFLLYETGMRIGQALGLHHEDIKIWDNEIYIQPRSHNENGARSKSMTPNIIHVSTQLMELYNQYLINECDQLENKFVFIQTKTESKGRVLAYSAVLDLFVRLSKKTGVNIRPHMLRHTHATELFKNGWDSSYVQKRLGHADVQTTINTYAHLNDEDLKQAFKAYKKSRGEA